MKNLNLCLHAGGQAVSLDDLTNVPTPEPEGIWRPIPHRRLYDLVRHGLDALSLHVDSEVHALAHDGARMFSLLQVSNSAEAGVDFSWVLGLRNSHDKSFPAGLVCGMGVFVCDNLCFSGEIKIARKHTTYIERDLPRLVGQAVGRLHNRWAQMGERVDAYKSRPLMDAQAHDLIIRGLDVGACTATQIPHILEQWRKPAHPEFAEPTVWALHNAFTEVHKDSGVFALPKRGEALHALLDGACGLSFESNN